jgi:type IV fimbrial biogenesis protein FimT
MRNQLGLSLLEVVIAVAVAGLLLSLAVPSFQAMQARRAVAAAIATIESDFALARSEAIRQGHSVTICSSSTAGECLADAASGDDDWTTGWIIYAQPTTSGSSSSSSSNSSSNSSSSTSSSAPSTAPASPASSPLRVQGRLAGIQSIQASDNQFTFRPTGLGKSTSERIVITPQADATQARWLCMSTAGRLRVAPEGAKSC